MLNDISSLTVLVDFCAKNILKISQEANMIAN